VKNGNKEGGYKDSAPCSRCAEFMKSLQIKNIIWSNDKGSLSKCKVDEYETDHESQGNKFIKRGYKNREM